MVVALLSILFVVGVAFLNTVTFESRSVRSAEKVAVRDTVVDALLNEVRAELRKSFVGRDGQPWNNDLDSPIGKDIYGEVPGIYPLIASIDPYQDPTENDRWFFFQASDLELAISNTRLDEALDDLDAPATYSGVNLVQIDVELEGPLEVAEHENFFRYLPGTYDETDEGTTNLTKDVGNSAGPCTSPPRRRRRWRLGQLRARAAHQPLRPGDPRWSAKRASRRRCQYRRSLLCPSGYPARGHGQP